MTKEQIIGEALSLSSSERDEVAEALWQSISADDFNAEQIEEFRRRIEAVDSGRSFPIPGEQVMKDLRHRFGGNAK